MWYTDTSIRDTGSGVGRFEIKMEENVSMDLSSHASVFQVELIHISTYASTYGTEKMSTQKNLYHNFQHQATIKTVRSIKKQSVAVKEYRNTLAALA